MVRIHSGAGEPTGRPAVGDGDRVGATGPPAPAWLSISRRAELHESVAIDRPSAARIRIIQNYYVRSAGEFRSG
jgi:hypothetical protein